MVLDRDGVLFIGVWESWILAVLIPISGQIGGEASNHQSGGLEERSVTLFVPKDAITSKEPRGF